MCLKECSGSIFAMPSLAFDAGTLSFVIQPSLDRAARWLRGAPSFRYDQGACDELRQTVHRSGAVLHLDCDTHPPQWRMMPSLSSREPSTLDTRWRCASSSARVLRTFHVSEIRVALRFTCCPPGPLPEIACIVSSLMGIVTCGVTITPTSTRSSGAVTIFFHWPQRL